MTIIFYDFYDFIKKGSIRIMDIPEEMEKTERKTMRKYLRR